MRHFTSWLGLCPNWRKTGGKVQSSRTRVGENRAAQALRLAAWGLVRSTSYLGAYLRRQRSRLGAPKAITATAHRLARIVYHLTCYRTGVVEAAPGGRVNRMQRTRLDPGNPIAGRPPAPSTSDAIPGRLTPSATPHS